MRIERIIVADPCPDNRESLSALLRLHGYAVVEASSLEILTAGLRVRPADLVVTEIFGDLSHTYSAIRDAAPNVLIVFHTTCCDPANIHHSARLGCRYFLKATDTTRLGRWLAILGVRKRGAGLERWALCPN